MTSLHAPLGGWTIDDLPDEIGCELVDGALLVSPPPRPRHTAVAGALHELLSDVVAADEVVLEAAGVRFDAHNYREPDVAVVRRAALDRDILLPSDVLLAVEVMSPSSVANDCIAKPAQYAAAGIAYFWRIEQEPAALIRHVLVDGVYREAGRSGGVVQVDEPWAVAIDVDALFG